MHEHRKDPFVGGSSPQFWKWGLPFAIELFKGSFYQSILPSLHSQICIDKLRCGYNSDMIPFSALAKFDPKYRDIYWTCKVWFQKNLKYTYITFDFLFTPGVSAGESVCSIYGDMWSHPWQRQLLTNMVASRNTLLTNMGKKWKFGRWQPLQIATSFWERVVVSFLFQTKHAEFFFFLFQQIKACSVITLCTNSLPTACWKHVSVFQFPIYTHMFGSVPGRPSPSHAKGTWQCLEGPDQVH